MDGWMDVGMDTHAGLILTYLHVCVCDDLSIYLPSARAIVTHTHTHAHPHITQHTRSVLSPIHPPTYAILSLHLYVCVSACSFTSVLRSIRAWPDLGEGAPGLFIGWLLCVCGRVSHHLTHSLIHPFLVPLAML
mmetsp:Transcript_11158/g.32379  ORF Transcript_11158/g.32379 Transcript_11158/m.32379 type:complete len:134 (+) Transcript_11158:203-604(+)